MWSQKATAWVNSRRPGAVLNPVGAGDQHAIFCSIASTGGVDVFPGRLMREIARAAVESQRAP